MKVLFIASILFFTANSYGFFWSSKDSIKDPTLYRCTISSVPGTYDKIVRLSVGDTVLYSHSAQYGYTSEALSACENIASQANILGFGVRINTTNTGLPFDSVVSLDTEMDTNIISVDAGKFSCTIDHVTGTDDKIVRLLVDKKVIYSHSAQFRYTSDALSSCENIANQATLLGVGVSINNSKIGLPFDSVVSLDTDLETEILQIEAGRYKCTIDDVIGTYDKIVRLLVNNEVIYSHTAQYNYTGNALSACENIASQATGSRAGLKIDNSKIGQPFYSVVSVND